MRTPRKPGMIASKATPAMRTRRKRSDPGPRPLPQPLPDAERGVRRVSDLSEGWGAARQVGDARVGAGAAIHSVWQVGARADVIRQDAILDLEGQQPPYRLVDARYGNLA